jgi:hypothetical protein
MHGLQRCNQHVQTIATALLITLLGGCSSADMQSMGDAFRSAGNQQAQSNRNAVSSNANMTCPPGQYRVNHGYGVFSCQSPSTSASASSSTSRPQTSTRRPQSARSETRTVKASGDSHTQTGACVNAMRSVETMITAQGRVQRFSDCSCARKTVRLADGRSVQQGFRCEVSADTRLNAASGIAIGSGYGSTRSHACGTAKSDASNTVFVRTNRTRRAPVDKMGDCSCSATDDGKNQACMMLVSY